MLYDAGAKEVHVKIACPEIRYPDFYGVDTPTKKELLAANKTNDEICKYIGAKSLKFLSLDGYSSTTTNELIARSFMARAENDENYQVLLVINMANESQRHYF